MDAIIIGIEIINEGGRLSTFNISCLIRQWYKLFDPIFIKFFYVSLSSATLMEVKDLICQII